MMYDNKTIDTLNRFQRYKLKRYLLKNKETPNKKLKRKFIDITYKINLNHRNDDTHGEYKLRQLLLTVLIKTKTKEPILHEISLLFNQSTNIRIQIKKAQEQTLTTKDFEEIIESIMESYKKLKGD